MGEDPPQQSTFTPQGPPTASPAQRSSYTTQLSPADETSFQKWTKDNQVPWQDEPRADYDMRGFYKGLVSGDPRAKQDLSQFDGKMHFPDTWKTPYHKTFSNESIYAPPDAPHWVGDRLIDKTGKVIADETPPSTAPQGPPAPFVPQGPPTPRDLGGGWGVSPFKPPPR
jgi:hypothetical protein